MRTRLSRAWLARALVAVVVLVLVAPAATSATTAQATTNESLALQRGTVTSPANGTTVVSVQGFNFRNGSNKKPSRLVAVDERGRVTWVYDGNEGWKWFFDVDPLPNGNLLVVSPRAGDTVVYELDPTTRERVWQRRFDYTDTHDVDVLSDDELVISVMRAWNESSQRSDDRIVVYNRTRDTVTWQWYYREHFPASTDGGYDDDWTHSNDVDVVDEHRLLLSPRNFDQVVVLNRTTGDIENRLGEDGDFETLKRQHNPDYLVGEDGTPTMLVADSDNDRVVEYAYTNGTWSRTWTVGSDSLKWPRDADRLPNGNTLITDTLNHRVIEVTPRGDVVWEFYAPWGPYDAERIAHGGGSSGPTMRELNATGSYAISGSANLTAGTGERADFPTTVEATFAGTPLQGPVTVAATWWSHRAPWVRPVWLSSWDFAWLVLAAVVAAGWLIVELAAATRRRWPPSWVVR